MRLILNIIWLPFGDRSHHHRGGSIMPSGTEIVGVDVARREWI